MNDPTTATPVPVIAIEALTLEPRPDEWRPSPGTRGRFEMRRASVGTRLGLGKLGCSLVEVPPGNAAYPFHNHRANDELFHVIAGQGELRFGSARHPVTAGDLVGCPAGGRETAHQLVNTGSTPLRYLAISTLIDPEICEYPDSDKVGAYSGDDLAGGLVQFSRGAQALDYWDGE